MLASTVIAPNQELIDALEELLVKQFRTLQSLVKTTHEERAALTKGDAVALKPLVEEKEIILDQLGVLEDSGHMIVSEIAQDIGVEENSLRVSDILPRIETISAERIGRLSEGIATLSDKARELNLGNQALAANAIDILQATQTFLLSLHGTPETYDVRGQKPTPPAVFTLRSIDHKA